MRRIILIVLLIKFNIILPMNSNIKIQWKEDFEILKSYIINSEIDGLELESRRFASLECIYLRELEYINNTRERSLSILKKIKFKYIKYYLDIILKIRTNGHSLAMKKDPEKNYKYYAKYYIETKLHNMLLQVQHHTIDYKIFRFIYDIGFHIVDDPVFTKFLEYINENISSEKDFKIYIDYQEMKVNIIKQILEKQIKNVSNIIGLD